MVNWHADDSTIDGRRPGPDSRPDAPGLREAIRMARFLPRRAPTPDDAPDISTLPMTPAARAALQISRSKARKRGEQ